MTQALFLEDAYVREATAKVVDHTDEGGVILDQSLFYATSGGQPGDSGLLSWGSHTLEIATQSKRLRVLLRWCRQHLKACRQSARWLGKNWIGRGATATCEFTQRCICCRW